MGWLFGKKNSKKNEIKKNLHSKNSSKQTSISHQNITSQKSDLLLAGFKPTTEANIQFGMMMADLVLKQLKRSSHFEECPICGRNSFVKCDKKIGRSCDTEGIAGLLPISNMVGDKTGVCERCGAMCDGTVFLTGLDIKTMVYHLLWNNTTLHNLIKFALKKAELGERINFDPMLDELSKFDPEMYTNGNFAKFFSLGLSCLKRINDLQS